MSYYEDMLRENSIIFNGIRRHSYSGVQFKDKDDIEFVENCTELKNKYNHSKSSSSLSSCIVGSTERKTHTNHPSHQFSSDVKYNFKAEYNKKWLLERKGTWEHYSSSFYKYPIRNAYSRRESSQESSVTI